MVVAVRLLAEVFVLKGMRPGGVVTFPTRVEFVELVGRIRWWTKEGMEEDFRVLIIVGEYGFDWEWGKGDMDDSHDGQRVILLGSKAMDDGRVELMRVREVEVEATALFKTFGAQGALVESTCRVK